LDKESITKKCACGGKTSGGRNGAKNGMTVIAAGRGKKRPPI